MFFAYLLWLEPAGVPGRQPRAGAECWSGPGACAGPTPAWPAFCWLQRPQMCGSRPPAAHNKLSILYGRTWRSWGVLTAYGSHVWWVWESGSSYGLVLGTAHQATAAECTGRDDKLKWPCWTLVPSHGMVARDHDESVADSGTAPGHAPDAAVSWIRAVGMHVQGWAAQQSPGLSLELGAQMTACSPPLSGPDRKKTTPDLTRFKRQTV